MSLTNLDNLTLCSRKSYVREKFEEGKYSRDDMLRTLKRLINSNKYPQNINHIHNINNICSQCPVRINDFYAHITNINDIELINELYIFFNPIDPQFDNLQKKINNIEKVIYENKEILVANSEALLNITENVENK